MVDHYERLDLRAPEVATVGVELPAGDVDGAEDEATLGLAASISVMATAATITSLRTVGIIAPPVSSAGRVRRLVEMTTATFRWPQRSGCARSLTAGSTRCQPRRGGDHNDHRCRHPCEQAQAGWVSHAYSYGVVTLVS